MKKLMLSLFCVLALLFSPMAHAQRVNQLPFAASGSPFLQQPSATVAPTLVDGIAVIVNDTVISNSDLNSRLALALLSAGMPNVPETRQRILPQVMRALIEEQLVIQEAQKLGLTLTEEEIQDALAKLAQENKVPGGDMEGFLKSKNIPLSTLRAQIKGALSWNKVIMREIRPRIEISDDEVESIIQTLKDNAGKQEYLVSEIFLTVEKKEDEEQVKAFAEKLMEQIKGGAVFSAVARQFSQGIGASNGGDIGWIRSGELAPEVDKLLQEMEDKSVSGPVRSASGYHIIGLRDKRIVAFGNVENMKVNLGQVFKAFSNEGRRESLFDEANSLRLSIKGCQDIESKLSASYSGWSWQDLGEVKLASAPSWLTKKVSSLQEGEASEPMATDKGLLILFLCSKNIPDTIDREAIRNAIGAEKMERLSRGFLRDLRRDAFIDVRLKEIR